MAVCAKRLRVNINDDLIASAQAWPQHPYGGARGTGCLPPHLRPARYTRSKPLTLPAGAHAHRRTAREHRNGLQCRLIACAESVYLARYIASYVAGLSL
jgi:hypothetical protein